MLELVKAVRRFGLGHMMKLRHAYRFAWENMFEGYLATTSMHALLNIGLIDELQEKGTVDIDSFAAAHGLDINVLRPLCEAFHSIGLFRKDGASRYSLEPKCQSVPEVMHGWLELSWGYNEIFHSLEALLKKEKTYSKDFYRRSDFVARGSGEMENWFFFPMANDIILSHGYKHVLDLGCGDGTFLRKLCKLNPEVQCYGIDIAPDAIEEGKQKVHEAGLEDRISLFAEDISKIEAASGPLQGVDAATIFFVLHELLYFGEDVLLNFLKSFRRVFPNVPLIAFEAVRPTAEQLRRRAGMAVYYFLYHDLSQQKPVDRERWKELFRAAGFGSIQEKNLSFLRSAVYILQ
ncbi:MAG TPA: methyltransferase domain-containing protein [Bryobacteraceae bacterium]|nr:methyltransferase domain-containing protein [Bryobacteraceae bacterium]